MSADLYIRSEYERAQAAHRPAWELAVEERDRLYAKHPGVHPVYPREGETVPPELRAAQGEVWRLSGLMRPPSACFCDPYNRHCLMAQLGIDWDDVPMEGRELTPDACGGLIKLVTSRRIGNDHCETEQTKMVAAIVGIARAAGAEAVTPGPMAEGEGLTADELEYFVKKKAQMIEFLSHAILLNESVEVSY